MIKKVCQGWCMLSNLPGDMGRSCVRAGVYKCVFCNNQFLSSRHSTLVVCGTGQCALCCA